ncbi:unnamed protein product [Soboliphyme baturini]|uniref:Secreted protein n=1 Tax=Soboliphyme baturini TaxID=241478 RepID=A0A183ILH5_9BILA|nr:unnamed protein product [Soboliphyme baturini]
MHSRTAVGTAFGLCGFLFRHLVDAASQKQRIASSDDLKVTIRVQLRLGNFYTSLHYPLLSGAASAGSNSVDGTT